MSKYSSLLSNTRVTIVRDLKQACEAEASLDFVDCYGQDEELAKEFQKLSYSEMMEYAITEAERLL